MVVIPMSTDKATVSHSPVTNKQLAHRIAELHGIDPELVKAVVSVESSWRSAAISSKGAIGLMQIMPFWTKMLPKAFGIEKDTDLFVPEKNLNAGCYILGKYLLTSDDVYSALVMYSGGEKGYSEAVLKERRRQKNGIKSSG